MAYTTGVANDMGQLLGALVNSCVASGWDWSANVLSKHGVYMYVYQESATRLSILGQTGPGTTGRVAADSRFGLGNTYEQPAALPAWTWPGVYHIFTFEREVYLVVQYGLAMHQWLAFGKSTLPLPGSGCWYSGSLGADARISNGIRIAPTSNTYDYTLPRPLAVSSKLANGYWAPLLFGGDGPNVWYWGKTDLLTRDCGGMLATGLDGKTWQDYVAEGTFASRPLLSYQPLPMTSETALLPIRVYAIRPENKISLALDLDHARKCSVAYLEPGQIITLGQDRWMVFPWLRKAATFGQYDTGHWGWAIRYEGE